MCHDGSSGKKNSRCFLSRKRAAAASSLARRCGHQVRRRRVDRGLQSDDGGSCSPPALSETGWWLQIRPRLLRSWASICAALRRRLLQALRRREGQGRWQGKSQGEAPLIGTNSKFDRIKTDKEF